MLIVLSGVETLNKKLIALIISTTLNKKVVGDYSSSHEKGFLEVLKNNEVVYRPLYYTENYSDEYDENLTDTTTGLILSKNLIKHEPVENLDKVTLDLFLEYDENILETIEVNHYGNWFTSTEVDLNIKQTADFENYDESWRETCPRYFGHHNSHSYEDVLTRYREKKYDYQIISGSFGKYFLEKIRKDLGEQNVSVINIVRNPSVAFVISNKPDISYESDERQPNNHLTKKDDEHKFMESYINSILIKNLDYVTTIKYEDILNTGKIKIIDKEINVTNFYKKFNNYITIFDIKKISPLNLVNSETLNKYNSLMNNLTLDYLNELNVDFENKPIEDDNITEEQYERIPKNFFQSLGYSILNYEQIVNVNT